MTLEPIGTLQDNDGDGGEHYWKLSGAEVGTLEELNELLFGDEPAFEELISHSCGCSHDCCGHIFTRTAWVIYFDANGGQAVLRQTWGRNV